MSDHCPSCGTPYDNHLSLHGTCAALLEARRERDEARAHVEGLSAANAEQTYRGNSVSHWYTKAMAYGDIVHGCNPALAAAGHPVDSTQIDGSVGGIARSVTALIAERDEARAALAAEQGKSEGAPSDGWRFGPDGWYNGEYVVIVDEVRQKRRAYYWGRCGTHAWKLAPCDHFRAGMLAADMDRSTIANATISGPK